MQNALIPSFSVMENKIAALEGFINKKTMAIVGEYTLYGGPIDDDHFLIIVFQDGTTLELDSGKAVDLLPQLESTLGIKIEFKLCNITIPDSRIIYPIELQDHPVFEYDGASEKSGNLHFLNPLKFFHTTKITAKPTQEVISFISNNLAENH